MKVNYSILWIFFVCSILIWCSNIIEKKPIISSPIDQQIINLSQWNEQVQKELLYMKDIQNINLNHIRYNSFWFSWDKNTFYRITTYDWEVISEPISRQYIQSRIKKSIENGEYKYN